MVAFIDAHREVHGVESICTLLPIAPSTYFRHKAEQRDPTRCSARAHRDEVLRAIIRRICDENHRRCTGHAKSGSRWAAKASREARCRVRRLMREMGLVGAVRGRAWVTTTQSQPDAQRPTRSRRARFHGDAARIQLWVADFTYVATWRGFVYVAFVIDVFARRIVGWRVAASLRTDFVLDALEQAIYDRCARRRRRPGPSQRPWHAAWVQGVVATRVRFVELK